MNYRNFKVALYSRVYEVREMQDPKILEERWAIVESQLKVDKFYIETHRDRVVASDENVTALKEFFRAKGIETAGGIAPTANEANRFESFCYTDPEDRAFVQHLAEHTARHFDEVILDDFFFANTKQESDIAAKGTLSWTDFRLRIMRDAAENLIIKPARAVNPNVKIVIKYPNWYEHFHGCGFDLELQPALFDGIYSGTETRQPRYNAQHLQPYLSYEIIRYFENIAPGRNGGGWVDTGGMTYADRYAEQLWDTMLAKAPEVTLFDIRQLLRPVEKSHRGAWQGSGTSFDFDTMARPHTAPDGSLAPSLTAASVAGRALEQIDDVVGKLGNPIGIPSYRPAHATGEEFLHNYLGTVGIPIELGPAFPEAASTILLTEGAACDPDTVSKIERRVRAGATVAITSGLLGALQDRGIRDIVECRVNGRKTVTDEFYRWGRVFKGAAPIVVPQIEYYTNDSWELIGAHANGSPLVLAGAYGAGHLLVLAIPDNPADLYQLPADALNVLRDQVYRDLPIFMEGPSGVSLFVYDNGTFVVQSFLPDPVSVTIVANPGRGEETGPAAIGNLITGETAAAVPHEIPGTRWGQRVRRSSFPITIPAHSYRAYEITA